MTAAESRLAATLLVALLINACASEPERGTPNPGDRSVDSPSPAADTPYPTSPASTPSTATPQLDQAWATAVRPT
jgi:hypothetical protein